MSKQYPLLDNSNRDTFFHDNLGTFTICEYDPDYYLWEDVVELAKEKGYLLKYISKDVDRGLYEKLHTCGFYTHTYMGIPTMKDADFNFDPSLLDV